MSKSFRRVLQSADLPAPADDSTVMREVEVAGWKLLLARRPSGDVVAFATHCPHQGTPLKHAIFWGDSLQCAQHRYVYDPVTGENLVPSRTVRPEIIWRLKPGQLRTHAVEERDGWIFVADAPNPKLPERGPDNPPPPLEVPRGLREGTAPAPRPGPAEHPAQTVTVKAGAEFEIEVPTRAIPGQIWKVESGANLVVLSGQAFEPGDQPRYRLRFRAGAAGEDSLRCIYARPWGSMVSEVRTIHVVIEDEAGTGDPPAGQG